MYFDLVQQSGKLHAEIRVLKSIEKTLDRPFVFSGKIYDDDYMHTQIKRKRLQILQEMPELADTSEMKQFMLANGVVNDIRQIEPEEFEL